MKKVCCFLVFVLLLGSLVGCDDAALSKSTKKEIENAWLPDMGEFPGWYDKESGYPCGVVYYGSDNGYTILMANPDGILPLTSEKEIADCEFCMPNLFWLYAYKEGIFYELRDAYDKGYVSQAAIAAAFEAHKEYLCSAYPQFATLLGYQ